MIKRMSKRFKCSYCKKGFQTKEGRDKHMGGYMCPVISHRRGFNSMPIDPNTDKLVYFSVSDSTWYRGPHTVDYEVPPLPPGEPDPETRFRPPSTPGREKPQ